MGAGASFPADLKYAPTHEWVRLAGGVATVGITAHAVEQLGDLVYVDLPAVGRQLKAGESFGEIESVKAVSDLYAPVGGVVQEANPALADSMDLLRDDPYGKGWMIRIRVGAGGAPDLLDAAAYARKVAAG